MGIGKMKPETVRQYQLEERSLIAARVRTSRKRLNRLFKIMSTDQISTEEKVFQLKHELTNHHRTDEFLGCKTMGEIVIKNIQLLLAKDFKQSIVF